MKIRTRFAPSPTGFMHLGNLRTALYAWLFARNNGGEFILRIEDTDRSRYVEGAVDVILSTMRECGLTWDGEPVYQSSRKDEYMKYALQLVESGHAYHDEGAIRQRVNPEGSSSFVDSVYGKVTINNSEIEEQILIKSDGFPTYNFANVVDDHLMGITHIIRGNEYLTSTPKYNLLYEAFGWDIPVYIHVAPIMKDATRKLSKRDGDAYFSDFKDKGYLTAAIVNYIALLGWSPKGEHAEREIFTLGELTELFSVEGISKAPAIFDEEKMRAVNAQHIRALSPEEFQRVAAPYLPKADIDVAALCAALQPRTEVLTDIPPQVDFIESVCEYSPELYTNKKMKTSAETAAPALADALKVLETIADFSKDGLYNEFKKLADEKGVKIGYYLYPLQIALSGKAAVPGGGLDICAVLGREESLKRVAVASRGLCP